jgi:hypothetical protein
VLRRGVPALYYGCHYSYSIAPYRFKIVEALLQRGVSPNTGVGGATAWEASVFYFGGSRHSGDFYGEQLEILNLLIQHGADPNATVLDPDRELSRSGTSVLEFSVLYVILRTISRKCNGQYQALESEVTSTLRRKGAKAKAWVQAEDGTPTRIYRTSMNRFWKSQSSHHPAAKGCRNGSHGNEQHLG